MSRRSSGSIIGKFFYLILQLVVVFAGVYGAFYLNEEKEKKAQLQKTIQIHEHFYKETTAIIMSIDELNSIDSAITKFQAAIKNLEMPHINNFHTAFMTSAISNSIWNSILNSGGMNALKFETLMKIDMYMNMRAELLKIMREGNEYQKDLVLPNLDKGQYEFYDFRTKKLKPKYQWFQIYLLTLKNQVNDFKKSNAELNKYLLSELEVLKEQNKE